MSAQVAAERGGGEWDSLAWRRQGIGRREERSGAGTVFFEVLLKRLDLSESNPAQLAARAHPRNGPHSPPNSLALEPTVAQERDELH